MSSSNNAALPFTCELTGELLTAGDAVVTPSGHVCSRKLLLQKLAETGGQDPFEEEDASNTVTEDDLIVLKLPSPNIPPRMNNNSMSQLLQQLNTEYNALVQELVDTRTALQQTRQELSAALYQNDAAVRVVARLAVERDAARAAAAGAGAGAAAVVESNVPNKKRRMEEIAAATTSGVATESTTNEALLPLHNDIPAADLQIMMDTWQTQHESRKSRLKQQHFSTPDELRSNYALLQAPAWHKTTCRGIAAMAAFDTKLLTAGKDKHLMVYDTLSQKVVVNVAGRAVATAVDVQGDNGNDNEYILAGYASGDTVVYHHDKLLGAIDKSHHHNSPIQHVQWHPSRQHFVLASESGRITIGQLDASKSAVQAIAILKPTEEVKLTTGALHPDGLIYIAASAFGGLAIWDLKQKTVASTLQSEETAKDAVTAVAISPNGYHVAAAYAKSNTVRVWDLRKQKVLAVLNNTAASSSSAEGGEDTPALLTNIQSITFDPAGKYIAYGGPGGIHIVTVKEWDRVTAVLQCQTSADSIVWLPNQLLAASSHKNRKVGVFGKKD